MEMKHEAIGVAFFMVLDVNRPEDDFFVAYPLSEALSSLSAVGPPLFTNATSSISFLRKLLSFPAWVTHVTR